MTALARNDAPDCRLGAYDVVGLYPPTSRRLTQGATRKYNVFMIEFEWNPQKARTNREKHGVSFEEAKSVFYDEYARQFFDEDHSSSEERFIMLGLSNQLRVLVVCHCERAGGDVIRIISARKATANERKHYEGPAP